MRIEWVRAAAFGGLRRGLELTLKPGLNIIAGPNGSGKTTWHAALYAAVCGHAPTDAEGRFGDHKPLDGQSWEVEARIRYDHEVIQVNQDLTLARPSIVTAVEDGSLLESSSETIDLMARLGLDRDAFAATGWIEQDRRPQRPDAVLVHAVERHLDAAGVQRATQRLNQARTYVGSRLTQAGAEYERCLKAQGAQDRLEQQRADLDRAVAAADSAAVDARERLQAAEAVLAEREVRRLTDEIDKLEGRSPGYPGPTTGYGAPGYGAPGYPPPFQAPPPSTRDTDVHPSVEEAWQAYLELQRQYEQLRRTPAPPPPAAPEVPRASRFGRRDPVPAPRPAAPPVDTRLQDLQYALDGARQRLTDALVARDHPAQPATVDRDVVEYRERCAQLKAKAERLAELRAELVEQERLAQQHRLGLSQWVVDAMRREEPIDLDARKAVRATADDELAKAQARRAASPANSLGQPTGLAAAKELVDRLRRLEQVLTTAALLLGQARREAREAARQGIQQHLRLILPDLTEEGTHQVEVTADLEVRLVRLRDGKAVPGPRSTVDEYGVLSRVAMGYDLIGDHELPPLLLDDVTSISDPGRTRRLLDRLYQSAVNQQIVVFAHDQATRDWACERRATHPRLHLIDITSVEEAPTPA